MARETWRSHNRATSDAGGAMWMIACIWEYGLGVFYGDILFHTACEASLHSMLASTERWSLEASPV